MIRVSSFGRCDSSWRNQLIEKTQRLIPFQWEEIAIRKMPDQRSPQLLPEEKKFLEKHSQFHLLDVGGKSMNDDAFYQLCMESRELHLIVGPAIGFHEDFRAKAKGRISLSPLTFTHELAQVVLAGSIFRAAARHKNHPFVK